MPETTVKIGLLGAGLMGRQHIAAIAECEGAALACVIDPDESAQALAREHGVDWRADLQSIPAGQTPGAFIVATPNQHHEANAVACMEMGCSVMVEKPVSGDIAAARRMVDASQRLGQPLLAGYHRRHSAVTAAAKAVIERGDLGRIIAVNGMCWLYKPDDYFSAAWRTQPGAGPLGINLVHDIDLLCYLAGPVAAVHAVTSNAMRGFAVEDTAAVMLEFENGAIGTLSISDTIVAPWSWELTTGENKAYPKTDEICYHIGGSHAGLSIPAGELWRNPAQRGWWEDIGAETITDDKEGPLVRQVRHFCAVVRGDAAPIVTAADGLLTLRIFAAIHESARTGKKALITED